MSMAGFNKCVATGLAHRYILGRYPAVEIAFAERRCKRLDAEALKARFRGKRLSFQSQMLKLW